MAQQSLIYSFVARGTVILVDFTDFKGNFTSIAAQCLQKLPSSNNKVIYNCDGHTFNYLVENGFKEQALFCICYSKFSALLFLAGWFRISLPLIVSKGSWVRISPKES
ncbi:BnaC04g43550D [Brassica napus]|uniref:BnaC04g43550D protein n=1 Tax=Brassica napus TaxID=3708 RepID=A0A078GF74_BRANA|nr:BnaC04g43550D [Brassica napus]